MLLIGEIGGYIVFRAKQDFYCDALQSHYCTGLTYTVRPGCDVLAKHTLQWLKEGKIEVINNTTRASISGAGQVHKPSFWERVLLWL